MMHKWVSKILLIVGLATISSLAIHPTWAQSTEEKEKPPVYIYVAQWAVPRADWPAYEKADVANKQVMEKLMADGTIVGYGFFKIIVHQEGAPTHGAWWTANSVANSMKALNVLTSQTGPTVDTQAKIFAQSRHWDLFLVSRNYGWHAGAFENAYLRVGTYKSKPHEGEAAEKAMKAYVIPTLEKLVADGVLLSYSIDHEAIHTDDPAIFDIAIIAKDADSLDKFHAALEAAGKANPTGGPAFGAATEGSAHRDFLSLAWGAFK
jgi:hypothetical protein